MDDTITITEERLNSVGMAVCAADNHAKIDAVVKRLLSQKPILAYILKYAVSLFAEYATAEIELMIEDVQVSRIPVEPGDTNDVITGMPQESRIPGEGSLTYDIRFFVRPPGSVTAEYILIIDIEAQGKPGQSYFVETRGIVYDARMISEQVGRNITHEHYERAQKVYSIWICMNCPQRDANSISKYGIMEKESYGEIGYKPRIDLMDVIVIRLPKDNEEDKAKNPANRLTGMLATLLSNAITPEEKLDRMANGYQIPVTEEITKEVGNMCDYSYAIEEIAAEKATEKADKNKDLSHIQSLMRKMGLSVDEAMENLEIDPDKRSGYKDIITGEIK